MNWNSKINPFGNYEDPTPPDKFQSNRPELIRKILWLVRNPLHNFTFHWIGFHGKVDNVVGDWKSKGLNLIAVCSPWFAYPLISYNGKYLEGYIGWRPNGALGLAFRVSMAKQAGD
jgi:hypothetical protein